DLAVGRSTTACTEHRHQTGDARSVSSSVTGVDVVGADHRPGELLGDEVQLVGRAGARKHAECVGAVELAIAAETIGGAIKGLIPGRRPQHTVVPDKRLGQSRVVLVSLSAHAGLPCVIRSVPYIYHDLHGS